MSNISTFCDVVERFKKLSGPLVRYVNASASSYLRNETNNYNANNALDSSNNIYHSHTVLSWLRIDFLRYDVKVENIRIQLTTNRDPTYWVLEGSTDRNTFSVIYENNGDSICDKWNEKEPYYCSYDAFKTYDVKHNIYKSIRLRMTKQAPYDSYYLIIKKITIYGNIIMTCFNSKCSQRMIKTSLLYVILVHVS